MVAKRAAEDPADVGTAFGLELSMEPPPEPQPTPARRSGWMLRLLSVRKPPR
jgi:hypothetical protein